MATQTIVKNTTYTLDLPIPKSPDEINLNTLRGVYINLTNEDESVTFNKVIDFTQLREKYSDFGTNPYHTVIKGLHNNTLKCDIIYDNETTPKLVLTYEWKEISSGEIPSDPAAREEQYHNIAITSGNDTTNLKIKIEPYVGATYDNCGIPGLVPYATPSEKNMFLKGDGIWDVPEGVKDINVTLDKETITETEMVNIDKSIELLVYDYDNANIFSFEENPNYSSNDYHCNYINSRQMSSNRIYSANITTNDLINGFYFELVLYPDLEYLEKFTSEYNLEYAPYYERIVLYVSSSTESVPIGNYVSNFNPIDNGIDVSELPATGETKTFHFTYSTLTRGGSGGDIYYWANRHLDFQDMDINLTNVDDVNYTLELYWNTKKEVEKVTEIAKINHNITKSDNSYSTNSLSVYFDTSSETKSENTTYLDISVDLEYDGNL